MCHPETERAPFRRPPQYDLALRLATSPATAAAAGASAVAATAASTVSATSTTTTAATWALSLGTRFVDVQISSPKTGAVQRFHGFRRRIVVWHFDEGEASRLSRIAVGDNAYAVYRPVCLEQRTDLAL